MLTAGQERKPVAILSPGSSAFLLVALNSTDLCDQEPLVGAVPSTSSIGISLSKLRASVRLLFRTEFPSPPSSVKLGSLFCSKGGCLGLRDVDAGLSSGHSSQV